MNTKLTTRLDQAIGRLYKAFTAESLHPECACNCAAGNVCDNNDSWKHFTDTHGSIQLNYVGRVHQALNRKINGYLPIELLQLEAEFLKGCGYELPFRSSNYKPKDPTNISIQFNGLYAAITYLCALDKVENVMDVMTVFRAQLETKSSPESFARIALVSI